MKNTYQDILEFIERQPVVNTHCHQDFSLDGEKYGLDTLFTNSYANWCGVAWGESMASRQKFLEKVRCNSYFVWLEKALKAIYHLEGDLTAERWDEVSGLLTAAHLQPGYWLGILRELCQYQLMIEDAYWNPGSNNGHPELFAPTFRVNSFFFGYSPQVRDHDGNNALHFYRQGEPIEDLDKYVEFVHSHILQKKEQGCVALKLPIAYDRGLDFVERDRQAANQAYQRLRKAPEAGDIKLFQDYLLFEVCRMAAEADLPLQVHTGMGQLVRTNAMWLQAAIRKNPATRFVLLHCSLPWTDDTLALVRYFPNVYPDLSHAPMFSSFATKKLLHELIEAGAADRICWGCDTWTPEESYGSLLALQRVLAEALAEKVGSGYLAREDAERIAGDILHDNARGIYRLK